MNPDLLFAGTEFGIFLSQDRGEHWQQMKDGLPTVSVDDIEIHPRDHELIAATHGRAVAIYNLAFDFPIAAVPEPATLVGAGTGLLTLLGYARSRRGRAAA